MQFRFMFLLLLLVPAFASAQIAYFDTGGNDLIKYHLDTHVLDAPVHMKKADGSEVESLYDMASDSQGRLFGINSETKLFEINPANGVLTEIGATGVGAIGLTFGPDGMLWAAGAGPAGGNMIYRVDPATAVETPVVGMLGATPSGDIAFSPKGPHKLYMAAGVWPNDLLVEIDTTTGATTPVGDFGCSSVWGMDFTDQNEDIFAMCGSGNVIMMKRVATTGPHQWVPQAVNAHETWGCYGATKAHCTATPAITLLDGTVPPVVMSCGDTPHLSGAHSASCTTRHQWRVAHINSNNLEDQSIEFTGTGMPGELDLKDVRFDALKINHHIAGEVRKFAVHLTNWCEDTYEPAQTTEYVFSVAPAHLEWKIGPNPWEQQPNQAPEYYYWEENTFAVNSPGNIKSVQWLANGNLIASGASTGHTWQEQDAGIQNIHPIVTFENGCVSEDGRDIRVIDDNVGIPNAFSPGNHDGVNDTFLLQGTGSSMLEYIDIRIFNRWGQLVFEKLKAPTAQDAAWDGKFNGREVDATVYVYDIVYKMRDGAAQSRPVHKTGNITVVR